MMSVVMGARDEDTLTSLAGKLTRLDKQLVHAEQKKYAEVSGGATISHTAKALLNSFDDDYIANSGLSSDELIDKACEPFYDPKLRDFLETARRDHDQIIDNINIDEVNVAKWNVDCEQKANEDIKSFRKFIEDNKDEIIALAILYNGSWKTRPLTLDMIQEVHVALERQHLTTERLWCAYGHLFPAHVKSKSPINKLIDIVSLLRFELKISDELCPHSNVVDYNFMRWTMAKNAGNGHFSEEQMKWLRMVKDFIANSMAINTEDLDLAPFNHHGGLGRFYTLFGTDYEALLDEMNIALVA